MTSGTPDVQGLDSSPEKETDQGPELVPSDGTVMHSAAPETEEVHTQDDTAATNSAPSEAAQPDEPDDTDTDDRADLDDSDNTVEEEGLRWNIVEDTPDNPFTSSLVFTEDGEPLLWWSLDPVTVNELLAALATVKRAQIAALTGKPVPASSAPKAPRDIREASPTEPAVPVDQTAWPWWRRHKVATFFLIVMALMFLIPLATVGGNV